MSREKHKEFIENLAKLEKHLTIQKQLDKLDELKVFIARDIEIKPVSIGIKLRELGIQEPESIKPTILSLCETYYKNPQDKKELDEALNPGSAKARRDTVFSGFSVAQGFVKNQKTSLEERLEQIKTRNLAKQQALESTNIEELGAFSNFASEEALIYNLQAVSSNIVNTQEIFKFAGVEVEIYHSYLLSIASSNYKQAAEIINKSISDQSNQLKLAGGLASSIYETMGSREALDYLVELAKTVDLSSIKPQELAGYYHQLGNYYYDLELFESAQQCYSYEGNYLKDDPKPQNFANARLLEGRCFYRSKQYGKAAICYEEALKIDSKNDFLKYLLIGTYYISNDFKNNNRMFDLANDVLVSSLDDQYKKTTRFIQGMGYRLRDENSSANISFNYFLASYAKDGEYLTEMARFLYGVTLYVDDKSKVGEALPHIEYAFNSLGVEKLGPVYSRRLIACYMLTNKLDKAEKTALDVMAYIETSQKLVSDVDAGKIEDKSLQRSIGIVRHDKLGNKYKIDIRSSLSEYLFEIYITKKNPEEEKAINCLASAIAYDPKSPGAYNILFNIKDIALSKAVLNKAFNLAVENDPNFIANFKIICIKAPFTDLAEESRGFIRSTFDDFAKLQDSLISYQARELARAANKQRDDGKGQL
jgi:tetratricopeptide (TPR) repeat protein